MVSLKEDDRKVVETLWRRIADRKARNELRSEYVEGERVLTKMGFSIPPGMESLQLAVGWPRKTCEVKSSRLVPDGFSARVETPLMDDLDDVFFSNQGEVVERLAIDAAVKHGVSFVFTTRGDESVGEPAELMTVRTALSASAIVDPRSRQTKYAVEILDNTRLNFYKPGSVVECERTSGDWRVLAAYPTGTKRVLCTPYVYGWSVEKPFGSSAVTRPLMGFTDGAVRVLLRQEVSAEFYSAPRLAALGADESVFMDQDGNIRPAWAAIMGSVWAVPDEEDEITGERSRVELHSLPQMSMQPHSDQLRTIAQMVSGETTIPLSYLGVMQDSNPTSAEAVEAHEIDLVRVTRNQFPFLGAGREQLALDVLTLRHGDLDEAARKDLRGLKARWVDPRYKSVVEQSQFVAQQVGSGNFQPGTEATLAQLPITAEDARRIAEENRRAAGSSVIERLVGQAETPDTPPRE
ncbi:SPP1 Gp6-like portal protein [Brevibacterium sanguinis]|uniref:SPP1 Gp6-like portal protein n=2 Tax=Brevibacterium TaxID=1696 RepID=A0A366IP13_9MICO|nr:MULTISPECIES: phage portal protein [Brevibacterium]RBP66427.1 SPP1 Gp6-like portal protein [Brevibacterium sanguinis]RBP73079.1 SPP1 Gp6-like portal protein [Brevibacterium celere]